MAKRFMDNTIFEKQWFRKLPLRLKVVWFYLINKCNHAGVWECDIDLLSFQIGEPFTLDEIMEAFGDNIVELGDNKYYLSKFIEFQYGLPLNPSVRVHQSVIKLLNKYGIDLGNSLLSVKDKDKDIVKDIEKRKESFAKRVEKEVADMNVPAKDIQDFISYWSEHNTDGRVMRFEKQDIFNVKRRMATWIKNSKKFQSTFQPSNEDIAATLQQKVNQVTNLELQNAALIRTIKDKDEEIAELKEESNAESRG